MKLLWEPAGSGDCPAIDVDGVRRITFTQFAVMDIDGSAHRFALEPGEDERSFSGRADDFSLAGQIADSGDEYGCLQFDVKILYQGSADRDVSLRIGADVCVGDAAYVMVPGLFYRHCGGIDIGHTYEKAVSARHVSDYWHFCSERSTHPGVMAMGDGAVVALMTSGRFSHGTSGCGFRMNEDGTRLCLDFPYREEPAGRCDISFSPVVQRMTVRPGETIAIGLRCYAFADGLQGFNRVLRSEYEPHRAGGELAPWMGLDRAQELTAHGLMKWHYDGRKRVLYETCAFDRGAIWEHSSDTELVLKNVCREAMHVGFVSGIPFAYPMILQGDAADCPDIRQAGESIIDHICENLAPAGTFWAQWCARTYSPGYQASVGWTTGWQSDVIQSRTIADATLFLVRSLAHEKASGRDPRPLWEKAARSNLDFAVSNQDPRGAYPSCHRPDGTPGDYDGEEAILWIAALVEAAEFFAEDRYVASARKAGEHYRRAVENAYITGAPEGLHMIPTSEDGNNALISYLTLYEATGDENYLELAKKAADWLMTFRYSYNVTFDEDTFLGRYDYRTLGADIASPSNLHLHNYGLQAHPELLRLWEHTRDDYYLLRARDNLFCFLQTIARKDGDMNAGKGMVTEQWYQTNNIVAPKGGMLQLSHSWCVGLVLYAAQYTRRFGSVVCDLDRGTCVSLEPRLTARFAGDGRTLLVENTSDEPLTAGALLLFGRDRHTADINVEAGATQRIEVDRMKQE